MKPVETAIQVRRQQHPMIAAVDVGLLVRDDRSQQLGVSVVPIGRQQNDRRSNPTVTGTRIASLVARRDRQSSGQECRFPARRASR